MDDMKRRMLRERKPVKGCLECLERSEDDPENWVRQSSIWMRSRAPCRLSMRMPRQGTLWDYGLLLLCLLSKEEKRKKSGIRDD